MRQLFTVLVLLYIGVSWVFAYYLRSQVPPEETIGWLPNWYWNLLRLHRSYHPKSRLRFLAALWEIGGFVLVLLIVFLLFLWKHFSK